MLTMFTQISYAANQATDLAGVIGIATGILDSVIPLLIGLALVYFIWGLVQFIGHSGDEAGRTEGKNKMFWGIITLFVIISVWGLVGILSSTFVLDNSTPTTPQF